MISKETYFRITNTKPIVPVLVFGPIAILMTFWAWSHPIYTWFQMISLILGGVFIWTLMEYVLHRFSFHFQTENKTLEMFTSTAHLEHHAFPNKPDYVIAPILYSIPMYFLEIGLLRLITQNWVTTALLGTGIIVGYLYYEWVHFMSHQKPARNSITKYLKKYHLVHHFQDSNRYFGVTSPLWDWIFGTLPKEGAVSQARILPIRSRQKMDRVKA